MKFVIAPDSFKGSLSSKQAASAIKSGLEKIFPTASYNCISMADGGEGTMQALIEATNGQIFTSKVYNPLYQEIEAQWGLLGNSKIAVIEMAQASGLQYVNKTTANPLVTTTYGTGQLIKAALDYGVQKIIVGLGGSATNDAGSGMIQALGARLLDKNDHELDLGGKDLINLDHLDLSHLDPRLKNVEFILASDVTNPLIGPKGASFTFGKQKGGSDEELKLLDKSLSHYAEVIKKQLHKDHSLLSGAGAAGGLGFGFLTFTNAKMKAGIKVVLKYSGFYEKVKNADYVFTGEGATDFQTQYGKTPFGVAKASKKMAPNCTVVCLTGNIGEKVEELYGKEKIDAIFSTEIGAKSLEQAIKDSYNDLKITSENIGRLIKSIELKQ